MTERTYTTERYTAELDAETYIERFRRADYFLKLCQQCGNYGRRYGCPPFDHDPLTVLQRYDRVQIIGIKVTPHDKTLPLSAAGDMIRPVTTALNEELLELEQSSGGMSFGFAGSCLYCGVAPCARIDGKPCSPADTNDTVITVVADEDCTAQVTSIPVSIPLSLLPVMRANTCRRLGPAIFCKASLMVFIPYMSSASEPSNLNIKSISILFLFFYLYNYACKDTKQKSNERKNMVTIRLQLR